jgi:hypothetical protein
MAQYKKRQTSPYAPNERAVHDVLDAIENDRISQREATRPFDFRDVVSDYKIERYGNLGLPWGDLPTRYGGSNPFLYEASASPYGLPIKAYEQIYRELGPEGRAYQAREESLNKQFPNRTPQPMRTGAYGRVILPTGSNGIQIVNSKQDPAYYKALENQQRNIERYYELQFDELRGVQTHPLGFDPRDHFDAYNFENALTSDNLGVPPAENIFQASHLVKAANQRARWFDMLGADTSREYDRQLLLQSMLATGKLDNTPIPELYRKVQDQIKEARASFPALPYNLNASGPTPDHPYVSPYVGYGTPNTAGWRDGQFEKLPRKSQRALLPAIDAMLNYNKQIYKIPELKPPLSDYKGRFSKGGHAGFVAIPKALDRFVGNAVMDAKVNVANANAFSTQYFNNPAFRSATNSYIGEGLGNAGKIAGGALLLGHALKEGPMDALVTATMGPIGRVAPESEYGSQAYREMVAYKKAEDDRRILETLAKQRYYEENADSINATRRMYLGR